MRISEHPYTWFIDSEFPQKRKVRDIAECTVWMTAPLALTLVLVDPVHRRVAVFEYDSLFEREQDIKLLHRLGDDGGGPDAGVWARLSPRPPGRSGTSANPLPEPEE